MILMIITSANAELSINGKFNTYVDSYSKNVIDDEDITDEFSYTSLQLKIDYSDDNFYFQAIPYVYVYEAQDYRVKSVNYKDPFDTTDFFFRSLYMSYKFNDWSVGIGVLPFSNSNTEQFSSYGVAEGVGLNTLNDNNLFSIFGTYNTQNSKTIFGYGLMEGPVPMGNYMNEILRDDTEVYFLVNTYEHEKFTFTSEAMYVDMKYNTKDLSEIYLFGFGSTWDDSEYSGWSLYNVLGASIYKNNADEVAHNILNEYGIHPIVRQIYPDNFSFNDDTDYGGSSLLGVRKDFDVFNTDMFINFEWFRTFGDWSSGNQGNPYSGKSTQIYNVRDDSYYVNYGLMISKNAMIRFSYSYLEFNEKGKIGAPAVTIPVEEFIGTKVNKLEIYQIMFTYNF